MLKRKYGDRSNWSRILERRYAQDLLDDEDFKGYVTLIDMVKVKEPLYIPYGEKDVCVVDDGYMWLQQFPLQEHHSITTTFDENGEVVQWYIDICLEIGIENDIPWMDDLFLDIVVLPSGEVFVMDEEELDEALDKGIINQELYDLAWDETNRLLALINQQQFKLLRLADIHKHLLEKKLVRSVL